MAENIINSVGDYLFEMRSRGNYTFTLNDIREKFQCSDKALFQAIYRYKQNNRIIQIRKEFYGIASPEYSTGSVFSTYLFLDSLMKSLGKPYYLGLINAAALHGAAHQQPMVDYVVTATPVPKNIINKKMKLYFVSKTEWNKADIVQKKTQAGYINVSSPELTALDLLTFSGKFGVNYVTTILSELHEEMCPSRLAKTAERYYKTSSIQRLGYIFDCFLEQEKLANVLYKSLSSKKMSPARLSSQKARKGTFNNKWKVIVNMELEPDLW